MGRVQHKAAVGGWGQALPPRNKDTRKWPQVMPEEFRDGYQENSFTTGWSFKKEKMKFGKFIPCRVSNGSSSLPLLQATASSCPW